MMIYTSSTWTTVIYMILLLDVCSTIHPNPQIITYSTPGLSSGWPHGPTPTGSSERLFDPWRAIDQGGSSPPTASFRRPRPEGNGLEIEFWCRTGASQKVDLKILRKKLLSDKHWQTSKESWGHSKIGMRNKRLQSTWGLNEWFEDEWFEGNTGLKVCSDFEVCCQKNRENSTLILKQARPILYQFINLNCIFVTPWMKLKHI